MQDLALLVRSRHPIIFIETTEKARVQALLMHLADAQRMPFYVWSRTKGLKHHFELAVARERQASGRNDTNVAVLESPNRATLSPVAALEQVETEKRSGIYNFQGLTHDLSEASVVAKLRDAAQQFLKHEGSIIITGALPEEIPFSLRGLTTVLRMPLPALAEYKQLIATVYRDLSKRLALEFRLSAEEMLVLARNLQGLTLLEAEKILTKVMVEDNELGPDDLVSVIEAKKSIVEQDGLLEFYPVENAMVDVAGLKHLKLWLKKRRAILQRPEEAKAFGLSFPKGVLLVGVQGGGKSLAAKAVASDWGLPLLKMDPSSLYNKFVGESEANFRRATLLAEKLAPVVLWVDEIEKAFTDASEQDGGVSTRVLGLFLAWLQERKADVFVVATANDVTKLPPELIRKGRFDELFFVDLPDLETRAAILALHLKKRKRSTATFDLNYLAQQTLGFSGAELEQVVVSALYTAFAEGQDLSTAILEHEIASTVPLSVTMAAKLDTLRDWARTRAVAAH